MDAAGERDGGRTALDKSRRVQAREVCLITEVAVADMMELYQTS